MKWHCNQTFFLASIDNAYWVERHLLLKNYALCFIIENCILSMFSETACILIRYIFDHFACVFKNPYCWLSTIQLSFVHSCKFLEILFQLSLFLASMYMCLCVCGWVVIPAKHVESHHMYNVPVPSQESRSIVGLRLSGFFILYLISCSAQTDKMQFVSSRHIYRIPLFKCYLFFVTKMYIQPQQ